MLRESYPLLDEELGDASLYGGSGGENGEGAGLGESSGESPEQPPEESPAFIRDMDEETAYQRLQAAGQFSNHIQGLESRLFGRMGPFQKRLDALEKAFNSQKSVDVDKIRGALSGYDEKLAEVLAPALAESITSKPLDESMLAPFLEPLQEAVNRRIGEQLVLSQYSPGDITDIIPEQHDGQFQANTQRQKDFAQWYPQQDYNTQQALLEFGPDYVHALRKFERWEKDRIQERTKAAGNRSSRLASGQQPSSQGRRSRTGGPQTPEEAFLAGYNSVD